MTADEMFKELGYKKQIYKFSYYKCPYIGYHRKKGEVPFEECTFMFHTNRKDFCSLKNIDAREIVAIAKKFEELGW